MTLISTSNQHNQQQGYSYKQLQAALKELREQGLTSIKLNSKQSVLQAEYERLQATSSSQQAESLEEEYINTVHEYEYAYPLTCQHVAPPIQAKLNGTVESSRYPFCSNTVKVKNNTPQVSTLVLPAMSPKHAPSWLCKPHKMYVIDGVDYLIHELEMNLKGQVCELPAAVNERKILANQPPRLQQPARKDRVSNARPAVPIVNSAKDLPKAKLTYSAEPASPYFIDTNHNRFTQTLGSTEVQALRNAEDIVRSTASAARRGIEAVIDIAKGFHKAQVQRALKVA